MSDIRLGAKTDRVPPGFVPYRTIFSTEEYDRLSALARARECSIGDVLRFFARTCQPEGGVGVVLPSSTSGSAT